MLSRMHTMLFVTVFVAFGWAGLALGQQYARTRHHQKQGVLLGRGRSRLAQWAGAVRRAVRAPPPAAFPQLGGTAGVPSRRTWAAQGHAEFLERLERRWGGVAQNIGERSHCEMGPDEHTDQQRVLGVAVSGVGGQQDLFLFAEVPGSCQCPSSSRNALRASRWLSPRRCPSQARCHDERVVMVAGEGSEGGGALHLIRCAAGPFGWLVRRRRPSALRVRHRRPEQHVSSWLEPAQRPAARGGVEGGPDCRERGDRAVTGRPRRRGGGQQVGAAGP